MPPYLAEVTSAISLLVALGALSVSIIESRANRPKVLWSASFAVVGGSDHHFIAVECRNVGRQPATATKIEFRSDKLDVTAALMPAPIAAQLPKMILVGEQATFMFRADATVKDTFNGRFDGVLKDLILKHEGHVLARDSWAKKSSKVLLK